VTVVLVDDHKLFRAGVRSEIGGLVDVVGEAATVAEAVAAIKRLTPQVVLLDVHLPDGGGAAVIASVGETTSRFLALSVSDAAEDSPRLAGFVLDAFRSETPVADEELDRLTPRERDVLRLLARGYAYKEIAAELFISLKTVETHASAVLRKLQLSNRRELSRWAEGRSLG
jgi:DNA-binding NarL/FixJ family response regulator